MERLSTAMLALGIAITANSCNERPEVSYPDRTAAEAAGAVSRGWIPEWIPKSARQIHEMHDVDTNTSILAFRFDGNEAIDLTRVCEQVSRKELPAVPLRASWWPNDVPPSDLATHRHVYYSCDSGEAYLAISTQQGEAYYWRP